jgi:hypothetical protein
LKIKWFSVKLITSVKIQLHCKYLRSKIFGLYGQPAKLDVREIPDTSKVWRLVSNWSSDNSTVDVTSILFYSFNHLSIRDSSRGVRIPGILNKNQQYK